MSTIVNINNYLEETKKYLHTYIIEIQLAIIDTLKFIRDFVFLANN